MADSPEWLTTNRLALRRFTASDLDWFAALRGDADVMRYMGGPQERSKTEYLLNTRVLAYYDAHPGLGIWMTIDRATRTAVGFHLLNHIQGESFIQVGFFLVKSAWGQGFGTEMATALVRYGFVDLSLPQIVGMAALDNHASQRVLQKSGLRRNGARAFPHPAYSAMGSMAWFERDADDWRHEHRQ